MGGTKSVKTIRKRSKQGKKKEDKKHEPFEGQPTKELEILEIFDCYNYQMGLVDGFDHLAAMNSGLRRVKRVAWQALEHWILHAVLVNTYVIAQISLREEELTSLRSQVKWREGIIAGLLDQSEKAHKGTPVHPKEGISYRKQPLPNDRRCTHEKVTIRCAYCKGIRRGDRRLKRVPLA